MPNKVQPTSNISTELGLGQFDPTLGTLTSINISFSGAYNGSASTTFDPANDATTYFQVMGYLFDASRTVDVEFGGNQEKIFKSCGFNCFEPQPATKTISVSDSGSVYRDQTLTDSSLFGEFIGTGQVQLSLDINGFATAMGSATLGGKARIIYYYDPATASDPTIPSDPTTGSTGNVPEPASWALMVAGFGMTGATLRRRRRSYAVPV